MTDPDTIIALAALLAGIGTAALICAAFFPLLLPASRPNRSRTLARLLDPAGREGRSQTSRGARRAQAIALRLVAEEQRMKQTSGLLHKLNLAGLDWSGRRYALCAAAFWACLFTGGTACGLPSGSALSASILLAVILPSRLLDTLAHRRQERFLAGFAGAVDMIVRSARSGLSLPDCLGMVASDAAPAVRREFAPVVAQLRAGLPLAAAMERLGARLPIPEVRFFVIVLAIQSQTGGNFTDALANLVGVLRERERLAAKVRTASAEVKASAITIGALPFVVVAATAVLAPDYIAVLWQEDAGRRLAGLCAVWLLLGIGVLRRMARIEV
jgi:tight adherence protein B